jgi:hypothetical protein
MLAPWHNLPGMPGRSYQTKPGLPSECQVNIKCFYAKSTCLGSNYRNISSPTLVQKVIPGYLQVAYFPWPFAWCAPHVKMLFHCYRWCSLQRWPRHKGSPPWLGKGIRQFLHRSSSKCKWGLIKMHSHFVVSWS